MNILQGANLSKGIKANGNTIKTTLNAVNTRFKAGSFRSRQALPNGFVEYALAQNFARSVFSIIFSLDAPVCF